MGMIMPIMGSNKAGLSDALFSRTQQRVLALLFGQSPRSFHLNELVRLAGVGSGSSLTGTGRFLKERIPGFKVVAVEPAASPVLSGGKPGPHLIQGIGADFVPPILDRGLLDEIIQMDGEQAIKTARQLMAQGLMVGISTGSNVRAALELAARPEMQGKNIVTFACDTGERYMSTRLFLDM